ncbi:hypothetical protein RhiJN_19019 [Ceratobasidium sp. AG-Ba]|nr:hypothetical protein RhiJN_19019 [Ceratobasidium sp. AG-Ba]
MSESEYPASQRITVDAAEQDHRIRAVTVFQTDRAEVRRRVTVELKRGQNYVDIERLPSCINEDSVLVEGIGSAVILDVVYHAPNSTQTTTTLVDDSPVAVCHRELESLKQDRNIAREQFKFLSSYGRSLDSKVTNSEELARFLDMFGPRQSEVAKRLQDLDLQIARTQNEYEEKRKLHRIEHDEKRCTKISVVVYADNDGKAEIMLTYVVSHASWTPLYDVHASVGRSQSSASTFDLHYRASITQTTGEDWSSVKLTLSTASPRLGTAIPSLSPWRIHRLQSGRTRSWSPPEVFVPSPAIVQVGHDYRYRRSRSRSSSRSRSPRMIYTEASRPLSPDAGLLLDRGAPAPAYEPPRIRAPSPMRWRDAQAVSSDSINTTFSIPGRSSIQSDETSHKVVIQVLYLQADVEWICVPKKQQNVFLRCDVVNTSDFTLLPGVGRVFLNGNFVSRAHIEHVVPGGSFKISLGSDPNLRVTYPSVRTLNHTTPQPTFLSRNKEDANKNITTYSQRITIRDPGSSAASQLHIFDQVPVSTDTIITVKVLVPPGLGPAVLPANDTTGKSNGKTRDWVQVRKGVKARWAPLEVGGEGVVEWVCDAGISEDTELELSWEVSAPVNERWQ